MTNLRVLRSLALLLAGALSISACMADAGDDDVDSTSAELGNPDVAWRQFAGLSSIAQIKLTRNRDGSLALFARTTAGGIRFVKQTAPNAGWTNVVDLGGTQLTDFTIAENLDGRLELFALGGDRALYHQWQTAPSSTSWSGWAYLAGTDLRDVVALRHADGRLQVAALGADGNVYGKNQTPSAGSGFGDWYWIGGPGGLTKLEGGVHQSGRLALLGLDTQGEMFLTSTPTVNNTFQGWTSLQGTALRDIDVIRNADGRLETVAIGGDANLYYKSQVVPDGNQGWSNWYRLLDAGSVSDIDTALGHDGSLNVFMVSGGRVHRAAQNGPSAGYIWQSPLGGKDTTAVEAERDVDGRLEAIALHSDGTVWQTWQTSAGGAWLPLPGRPLLSQLNVSPTTANVGTSVNVSWAANVPAGCTLYARVNVLPSGGGTQNIGSWNGTGSASTSFTLQKDSTVEAIAGCREHLDAGQPLEDRRTVAVKATTPPPMPKTDTYAQPLARDQVFEGAVTYSAIFGQLLPSTSKVLSIKNGNLFSVSLIGPNASNNDCWGSKAVNLGLQGVTSAADMTKLYGSATPGTPAVIRACPQQAVNGFYVSVTYQHP